MIAKDNITKLLSSKDTEIFTIDPKHHKRLQNEALNRATHHAKMTINKRKTTHIIVVAE